MDTEQIAAVNREQETLNDNSIGLSMEKNKMEVGDSESVLSIEHSETSSNNDNEDEEYGILHQTKIFERLQRIESNILTMRINSELIMEELRENTLLMKHLVRTTMETHMQTNRPATKRCAENSFGGEIDYKEDGSK
jgi:hypothetical protein